MIRKLAAVLAALVHRPTKAELRRAALISLIITVFSLIVPAVALAQAVNIDLGTGAGLTDRVIQLIGLITVLSLAPSIVIMTTSFVRIVVVLSLLRQALGLQQTPPNAVLDQPVAVPDRHRHGADPAGLLRPGDQAAAGPQDGAAGRVRRRRAAGEDASC